MYYDRVKHFFYVYQCIYSQWIFNFVAMMIFLGLFFFFLFLYLCLSFCCLGFHIENALAIHASDRETVKKSMKVLSDYYIWIGTCVADMQSLQVSAAIFHQTNELNLWNENQSETINGSVNEFRAIFFSFADRLGKKGQSTEKLTVFAVFFSFVVVFT